MTQTTSAEQVPASVRPPDSRRDGAISLAVNVLAVVLVAVLAFVFGTALYEGVPARWVAVVGIAAVVTALILAPDFGLLVWMALAPFGRLFNISMGQRLPDLSLNRIAALALLVVLLAQVVGGRRKLARLTAVEGWGMVFVLAMILSINGSRLGWTGGLQNVFDYVALPLLCYFFARNVLSTRRHLHWMAVTFALIGAALGFIAAREQLTNLPVLSPIPYRWEYGQHSVKVTSLFGSPAIMAMTLAMTLPFSLVGALRSRALAGRLFWFLAIGATAVGLLLTYVRAGWLAAVVGLATVLLLRRRAKGSGLLLLLIALLAALALAAGLIDVRAVQERAESQGPVEYRMEAISVGLKLAAASPLLGVGLDNFSDSAIAAGWRPLSEVGLPSVGAHNVFIYVLTSGGLLAFLPFLALLAAIALRFWRALRTRGDDCRDWHVAGLAMFLGYLLIANTIDALAGQTANMLFFLALGAVFADRPIPVSARTKADEGAPAP